MINAHELPLAALARQSAYIREVQVKDCTVELDRGGWGHLACASGEGHLPMHSMLVQLLLLGEEKPPGGGLWPGGGVWVFRTRLPLSNRWTRPVHTCTPTEFHRNRKWRYMEQALPRSRSRLCAGDHRQIHAEGYRTCSLHVNDLDLGVAASCWNRLGPRR